jgi:hypothetical protein
MQSTHLRPGTDPATMLLARMEEIFKMRGTIDKESAYPVRRHPDYSFYVNFIEENTVILANQGMTAHMNQISNPLSINETARNRFVTILKRVAQAHEGVSRQERLFVYRFWAELQKTF